MAGGVPPCAAWQRLCARVGSCVHPARFSAPPCTGGWAKPGQRLLSPFRSATRKRGFRTTAGVFKSVCTRSLSR